MTEDKLVAICIYCGKVLFGETNTKSSSGRFICSTSCGEKITSDEKCLELIRTKTMRGVRLSAIFLYTLGALFLLFGIPHFFMRGLWGLGIFLVAAGGVFVFTGYLYSNKSGDKKVET